jgi:hypothetical protein
MPKFTLELAIEIVTIAFSVFDPFEDPETFEDSETKLTW